MISSQQLVPARRVFPAVSSPETFAADSFIVAFTAPPFTVPTKTQMKPVPEQVVQEHSILQEGGIVHMSLLALKRLAPCHVAGIHGCCR